MRRSAARRARSTCTSQTCRWDCTGQEVGAAEKALAQLGPPLLGSLGPRLLMYISRPAKPCAAASFNV